MNAMAPKMPDAAMDETVAHRPNVVAGQGPAAVVGGTFNPTRGPRYTFGSGSRPLDGFTIKRAIGRGGFGEVYYATSDAGKEVALKLIVRDEEIECRGVIQCMNLKSQNLIAIHDLKKTDEGDTFVIMEFIAGPSLAQILEKYPKGMPLPEVRAWLKGLVDGVEYLHDHGIVHRDLKPANLFLEEGVVKIGDYGLSKLITASAGNGQSASVGTCHYMAPEIGTGKYNKPIDIYALGVVLFEMLTGHVPFDGESAQEVLMKHLTAQPDLSALPEPYRSIVKKAMSKKPDDRQSRASELLGLEAPAPPEMRIIGDNNPYIPLQQAGPKPPLKPAEDILLIGPEEEVFYIGPETRPARPKRGLAGWLGRQNRVANLPRVAPGRTAPARPQVQPVVKRVAVPPPRPITPPEPPPLPSPRIRVAELATSMLWATPVVGLFGMVASTAYGDDIMAQPQLLALLVGVTLLSTWGTLATGKMFDGRQSDLMTRRIVFLVLGTILGGLGYLLADWTQTGPSSAQVKPFHILIEDGYDFAFRLPNLFQILSFFGLSFFALNWSALTARDRKKRFRFWPVMLAGLLGAVLSPMFWPMDRPWGVGVLVLTAIAVQLSSPWSEAAAKYAAWRPRRVA